VEDQSAAPLFDTPGRGVVLICDQTATHSPLIGGDRPDSDERQFYIALFSGVLARSELNILFHASRRDQDQSVTAAAIERWRQELPPAHQARFRLIDTAPLDSLLGDIDLFVSFASPALVEACRRGLKPVQIGRVLIGSQGFTHVFGDCAAFIEWVAEGGFSGRLTLDEYSVFESFGDALRADPTAGSALARDPIVAEFWRANRPRLSPRQVIADILANPVGALRLLVGTLAGLFARKAGP
jgi:hypothetical protein